MNLLRVDFDFGDLATTQAAELLGGTLRADFSFPLFGPKGDKGDSGDAGPQGIQGVAGPKGDKGDTGNAGPQGIQGVAGPKGDTGDTGPVGPKGDKGDPGDAGPQGPAGPSGASDWTEISGKPSTFVPAAHASTHHTGGTDAIAPSSIGAQSLLSTPSAVNITGNTNIPSTSRNLLYRVVTTSAVTANLQLPTSGHQVGDVIVVESISPFASGSVLSIRVDNVTLGSISKSGEIYRFRAGTTAASGWSRVFVDTHVHNAEDVVFGTFDNARINFAAPANIGSTTPAAGSFTNLSASAELQLPTNAPASPSAGDLYRVTDTIRYRDSGNTERLLLNATDNLSNVADANTARINLSAAPALVRSSNSMSSNVSLSAGRARHITYTLLGGSYQVTLPLTGNQSGDVCRFTNSVSSSSGAILTVARGNGSGGTVLITTLERNQTVTCFNRDGTETGWTLDGVDTHTHAASEITSGTLDNARINFAAPDAIGSTTRNTGAFTTLNATNGTITASAPVLDLAQTWNNAAVTFTGMDVTITNTASALTSAFIRARVGTATRFIVTRQADGGNGSRVIATEFMSGISDAGAGTGSRLTTFGVVNRSDGNFAFAPSSDTLATPDLQLHRDAADTLAQRRSTNPQTFRLYNTFTDASNYERGFMRWSSNVLQIGTEKAGTGSARALEFQTDGTTKIRITVAGSLLNTTTGFIGWDTSTLLQPTSGNGTLALYNTAQNDFGRLQFGGTTSSFPALKRSSTTLQVRLADDSAFAPLEASTMATYNSYTDASNYERASIRWSGNACFIGTDALGTGSQRSLNIVARGTTAISFDANEAYMGRDLNGQGFDLYNFATIGFGNASGIGDAIWARDASDTIAQRRGVNAQAYRLYNTFSSTTSFERLNIRWATNECIIDAEAGSGGGTLRGIKIGSATSSLLGFYGATPVTQRAAIADATDAATTQARLNDLLAAMRSLGLIAT